MKYTILAIAAAISFNTFAGTDTAYTKELTKITDGKGTDSQKLNKLIETNWNYLMNEYPEWATYVGVPGGDDRWSDNSLTAYTRREEETVATAAALNKINKDKLTPAEKENLQLLAYNVDREIRGLPFKDYLMPLSQLSGIHQDAASLLESAPRRTLKDYENRLARLRALPKSIDEYIALMTEGMKAGMTPPKITLRDVPGQVKNLITKDAMKSPLLVSFKEMPKDIPASEHERIRQQAQEIYRTDLLPALNKLHDYLAKTYIPKCRETIGASDLPNGKAFYTYRANVMTTTDMTPDQIHELGLSEVKRIRGEMDKVIKQTGFKGGFKEFTKHLRTDPKFFYKKPEELIAGYRDIAKRLDPELTRLFGKLPRITYGVKAVPDFKAKSQTTAYYEQGSVQSGRPGYFYANTYNLKSRPKWEMEALTAHEAVPGHHFQIALAQELEAMPEFRKQSHYTAYVEGWGLYSESLGAELGLYKDPYSHYGQLTYEIWRAIRLVVDTGIHYKGWTRDQAIKFFLANASKAEHDVIVEVDRYIVWPGQALAYKIGELKFKELRKKANLALGEKFDVRAFHDVLLGSGALPLKLVEDKIDAWVALKKQDSIRKL